MKILMTNILLFICTVVTVHAEDTQDLAKHSQEAFAQCQNYLLQTNIDYKKAFTACFTAADMGHPEAQYKLALMHYKGHGTPQDYVLAYMCFTLAADQGNRRAQAIREHLTTQMTPCQITEAQFLADTHKLNKMPCP